MLPIKQNHIELLDHHLLNQNLLSFPPNDAHQNVYYPDCQHPQVFLTTLLLASNVYDLYTSKAVQSKTQSTTLITYVNETIIEKSNSQGRQSSIELDTWTS